MKMVSHLKTRSRFKIMRRNTQSEHKTSRTRHGYRARKGHPGQCYSKYTRVLYSYWASTRCVDTLVFISQRDVWRFALWCSQGTGKTNDVLTTQSCICPTISIRLAPGNDTFAPSSSSHLLLSRNFHFVYNAQSGKLANPSHTSHPEAFGMLAAWSAWRADCSPYEHVAPSDCRHPPPPSVSRLSTHSVLAWQ